MVMSRCVRVQMFAYTPFNGTGADINGLDTSCPWLDLWALVWDAM